MTYRLALLGFFCCVLSACGAIRTTGPVINSGSYDWTDQVRDAQGFPLPGWGNAIFGGGGFGDGTR